MYQIIMLHIWYHFKAYFLLNKGQSLTCLQTIGKANDVVIKRIRPNTNNEDLLLYTRNTDI